MSSESAPSSNSFDMLPCPSEAEYQSMAEKVHLTIPDGVVACDKSYRAILGKILLYMNRLKMKAPATWLPDVRPDFQDLLGYVAKNSNAMMMDLTQSGSIAYNNTVEQKIYIGGYFFGMDPLSAISTLIHESRHSVRSADGHVLCRGGDIPRSDGGCDQRFSTSGRTAGAYSYEVLWAAGLALYGIDISRADREFLMSTALTTLASRFNEIPEELAKKTDVLVALDKKGQMFVVDPTTQKFSPIAVKFQFPGESITRIEFAFRNSGVMIFTNQRHLYSWTYRTGLQFYNDGVIPTDMPVYDASRSTLPGAVNRTTFTLLTKDNTVLAAKLLDGKSKLQMVPFIGESDRKSAPPLWRYFLAQFGDNVFLTESGDLYMMSTSVGAMPLFEKKDGLQDAQGWQQGTGGIVYEDLFLLNKSGELKVAKSKYEEIDDDHSITTYSLANKPFSISGRGVKYFQGLRMEAMMNDKGHIFLRKYGAEQFVELSAPDIIDFTIIHNPVLGSKVLPQ
ncbi:MAG TPA: hypothetical protein VF412_01615 [Bdellovibrio sp.]|uniref:hypothetical protein n=1 Tax=Bdellovibrio sp. TaxID=28201 RepID=UPI002EE02AE9